MNPGVERQIDKLKFYPKEALENILLKNIILQTAGYGDGNYLKKEEEAIEYLLDKDKKK